jgi:putative molybdopterin biosynthesis protein
MQEHEYLTTAEVCVYLRLKERTIYDLVAKRAIPCSRAAGKLLFPRRLVDRWVESHVEMQDQRLAAPPPIVAGSSDPLLEWALRESGCGLATLFEGSGAGLRRFASGEAAAVGMHLVEADGGYNVGAARANAAIFDLVLVEWAWREQGFVVAPGNPLGLSSVEDLVGKRPRIILRQPGSGAQVLTDRLLEGAGLADADFAVVGTALTETDVAAQVADGAADCGLAIGAVARRFGLGFVPLARERFDLALRRRTYFEPAMQRLFAFARTEAFRARAEAFGHYEIGGTGTVVFNA